MYPFLKSGRWWKAGTCFTACCTSQENLVVFLVSWWYGVREGKLRQKAAWDEASDFVLGLAFCHAWASGLLLVRCVTSQINNIICLTFAWFCVALQPISICSNSFEESFWHGSSSQIISEEMRRKVHATLAAHAGRWRAQQKSFSRFLIFLPATFRP